jgi:hypothetical protein
MRLLQTTWRITVVPPLQEQVAWRDLGEEVKSPDFAMQLLVTHSMLALWHPDGRCNNNP